MTWGTYELTLVNSYYVAGQGAHVYVVEALTGQRCHIGDTIFGDVTTSPHGQKYPSCVERRSCSV